MCDNNTIKFILNVGIEEYEGVQVYFQASKYLDLPIVPQLKMRVLNVDEVVKAFDITGLSYDIIKNQYIILDSRTKSRYQLGSGASGRLRWIDEIIDFYTEHNWFIDKLERYEKASKIAASEIKWKNECRKDRGEVPER